MRLKPVPLAVPLQRIPVAPVMLVGRADDWAAGAGLEKVRCFALLVKTVAAALECGPPRRAALQSWGGYFASAGMQDNSAWKVVQRGGAARPNSRFKIQDRGFQKSA
jgi:hypothetical protein